MRAIGIERIEGGIKNSTKSNFTRDYGSEDSLEIAERGTFQDTLAGP